MCAEVSSLQQRFPASERVSGYKYMREAEKKRSPLPAGQPALPAAAPQPWEGPGPSLASLPYFPVQTENR